jgi:2-polyprenyl-3-methyl-5-hydroxy-6-metoxy-1,4-benzoquinol methylase
MEDYIKINKKSWNDRVAVHLESTFYDNESFIKGADSLKEIERALLPDLKGKKVLHLQCHFGQDTISLARAGAIATGLDFSEKAIETAQNLSKQIGVEATFVCGDLYQTPELISEQFDIVFTSYGTIGWLPDLDKWAAVIEKMLKPGGVFILVEFHPVLWMFDNDFGFVEYNYFNEKPIIESITGTYANKNDQQTHETISWNHSLDEVIGSLLKKNLLIDSFREYDYSPYNCFNGMNEVSPGRFQIAKMGNKLPMVYSIRASKK